MSHKLEQNGSQVAFVDNRNDAWHQLNNLPEEFQGQKIRAEIALEHAHLADWDVRKEQHYVYLNNKRVANPGQFATVRNNPWTGEPELFEGSSVGNGYTPVQNEENIDVLNAIIDETGATIETAGSINNGKNVFVTMQLPEAMTVADTDKIDLYLAGLNSHDGTSAYTLLLTPVRVVCANTQNYALKHFVNKHTIRHTKNATQKIAKAREALGLSFKYVEEFETEAERMIQETMTEGQFVEIVNNLWVPDEDSGKRGLTLARVRTEELVRLFSEATTQENIRNTNWAGLQAVTEYLDHFAPANGEDKAKARAERVLIGSAGAQPQRQRAFDLFSVN